MRVGHWRLYAVAFVLMAVAAGCTALTAYLLGDVINQAYVHKNFHGVADRSASSPSRVRRARRRALRPGRCCCRASATASSAANQRRMFDKLLSENLGFFADRHSSEFIARLNAGATAATQVLNLLITAVGRDFLTLLGLVVVMVIQDPMMSLSR